MALYEVVCPKYENTQKIEAEFCVITDGALCLTDQYEENIHCFAPGTWLEVWRREGVVE